MHKAHSLPLPAPATGERRDWATVKSLLPYLWQWKWRVAFALACLVAAKLANVRNELSALERTWMAHPAAGGDVVDLRAQLKQVNERLWDIEDDIRRKEQAQAFDEEFVRLARSVYFQNDERARIKKEINLALGSSYVEEKSYQDYRSDAAAP